LQDHGAAVFGGVNKWIWHYSKKEKPFFRDSILDNDGQRELSKRILVAYTGSTHVSWKINRMWIEQFLTGKTRPEWLEVNEVVKRLSAHIKNRKWHDASKELNNEVNIRKKITPEAFTPEITRLITESERIGCGARFTGAGGGGVVWALGEINDIEKLKVKWATILQESKDGRILECEIDPEGVREEV
jgi:D-glycero-alpha-D-manno-heptose-7-phosphate kinase